MNLTCDKAAWHEDSEGFWLSLRTQDRAAAVQLSTQVNRLYTVEAKPWRAKRSLDANGYYWCLLTKLAEAIRVSKPAAHNLMLRRYGQVETVDGKPIYLVLPESDEAEEKALEAETYHIKPTSEVKAGKDGRMYRTYIMLRGSSSYDTREMSVLIDGLVDECKRVGIETMTPEELARLEGYDAQAH